MRLACAINSLREFGEHNFKIYWIDFKLRIQIIEINQVMRANTQFSNLFSKKSSGKKKMKNEYIK